jgi:hypothetical protein
MTPRLHSSDCMDRATSVALHGLDPADVDPHVVDGPRAQNTLARILATGSPGPTTPPPVKTGLARRPRRRWMIAAAAVLAAGALVIAPGVVGGQPAYASWSATARAATPAQLVAGGNECRHQYGGPAGPYPGAAANVVSSTHALIVERRGSWTYVLLGGGVEPGFEATCLYMDKSSDNNGYTGGGSNGEYENAAVPADTVVVHSLGATGDENSSYADSTGRVGSDVASVIINTIDRGPVKATIHEGYFVAWWPASGLSGGGVTQPQTPTYTLVLKDGTTKSGIPLAQLRQGGSDGSATAHANSSGANPKVVSPGR